MEKKDKDFLLEMKQTIISIKKQIEELENKIDKHLQLSDSEDIVEMSQIITPEEIEDTEVPIYDDNETQEKTSEVIDTLKDEIIKTEEITPVDNFWEIDEISELSVVKSKETTKNEAVIDAYADRQAWRRDMPGTHVEDMYNAISLNDKILFINTLFEENSDKFNNTISEINQMNNFQEVIDMIMSKFPEWDLDSEVVYRFMMAARRRIN